MNILMLVNVFKLKKGIKLIPFLPLLFCKSSLSVKESQDRKKKKKKTDLKLHLFHFKTEISIHVF